MNGIRRKTIYKKIIFGFFLLNLINVSLSIIDARGGGGRGGGGRGGGHGFSGRGSSHAGSRGGASARGAGARGAGISRGHSGHHGGGGRRSGNHGHHSGGRGGYGRGGYGGYYAGGMWYPWGIGLGGGLLGFGLGYGIGSSSGSSQTTVVYQTDPTEGSQQESMQSQDVRPEGPTLSPEQERAFLEDQRELINTRLQQIENRQKKMELSMKSKGEGDDEADVVAATKLARKKQRLQREKESLLDHKRRADDRLNQLNAAGSEPAILVGDE